MGLLALALVAAACADSDDTPSAPAGAPAGEEKPRYGGRLVVGAGDPGMLNPALTPSGTTHPVTGQIFNGLVRLDRRFNPLPDLAQSWTISSDGKTYTFKLVPGVRWHDGRPFSSADVKYSFEQVLTKLHSRTITLARVIEGIDTPDETTVVFRLRERYTPFLRWLDEDNGAILPRHLYEGTDPLTNPANARPVGTGPFKFDSAVPGDRITLVRNPEYFKKGLPYLDEIVFRIVPAPPQAVQAFEAGELNLLLFPDPAQVERLKAKPGTVVTEDGREGFARVIRLIPNLRKKPFDDPRVRKAMAHAIDRDFIARTAYAGTLKAATGPLSQFFPPFYTADVPKYPRDLNRARALLDEAGLAPDPDGVRFRASFIFDQPFARAAEIVRQQLGEVGIALEPQILDFNAWV
ncbi:MAG: ABC transporter substrate-binding protein, partial [Acidimicrobiales bacterium]